MSAEGESRSRKLIDRALEQAPGDDARLRNTLAALQVELDQQERERADQEKLIAEYEEAYQKLTAPANRVGIFLTELEQDKVLVALGDTEFVALVDPKLERDGLVPGARVLFNEAYAIVGILPPHPSGSILKVTQTLADGRLRVGGDVQGQQGRLVQRACDLAEAKIVEGDEVRIEPNGRIAIEHFPREEARDYFVEDVPVTPWEAVGGQEEAIQLIRETIEHPLLYPDLYEKFDKKPVKGILLYGPPGCGKTLIGKATAYNLAREYSERMGREVKEYFMHISGPKILNMWLGETERMVREIFATARQQAKEGKLVVIFIDEAESILRTRSSGRWLNISNTVVPQFCAEMDGMVALENVVILLTSNRPDYIDPAVLRPERIDRKVKINRPTREAAMQIFSIYLSEKLPIDPRLVAEYDGEISCARRALLESAVADLWRQSKETEFLRISLRSGATDTLYWKDLASGALIKSVVDRAKDLAIRRAIADPNGDHGINLEDMREALAAEYRENEIFPKSDVAEDWLKLIDVEPENVVAVKPIRSTRTDAKSQKTII